MSDEPKATDQTPGETEPYIIKGRDALYSITRHDLIEEYKEAIKDYRKAKARIQGIRFAVRGLSLVLGLPIPEEGQFGPILPEERDALSHFKRPLQANNERRP